MNLQAEIQEKIALWNSADFDAETRQEVSRLQTADPEGLTDAFYRNLEFGTGGLRGIMGAGTNRMNKYTVGMATQGFANYLNASFGAGGVSVAVAHDSRNGSRFFAETVANVFAANGIKVYLFKELRPTPELSFAIRHLGCQGGVVLTASHNPKEYNGYKAYWNDGAQLVPPHDKAVIGEVEKIASVSDVKWSGGESNIYPIGEEVDEAYIAMAKGLSVHPEAVAAQSDLKIVYTSIHGTGITLVPKTLEAFGFRNVQIVEGQATPDGNFPTVVYPNPEESEAMSMGLQQAAALDADILCGTDPDADRVGIGVKNSKGEWVLLNGNQTAVLAFTYFIENRKKGGLSKPTDMVVKTIVTSNMIDAVAAHYGVTCYNVLTGFKWIADLIRRKEGEEQYIVGGEESYGLMIGDKLRDKDAVSAVAILCEMAAYEKDQGRSLWEKLIDLYVEHGCYKEDLVSITKKGMNGQKEIAEMMDRFRMSPPEMLGGVAVAKVHDYELQQTVSLADKTVTPIDLPKSNVLQFELADGSMVSARPSGTEPKIKFYFSVREALGSAGAFESVWARLDEKIKGIVVDLGV